MQTALNPKPTDDPHDVLVVAPGVAVMVPTDEELSKLARSLRHPPYPQAPTEADLPLAATVPPVDTTFRPTAVGDVRVPGQPLTTGGKAARALAAALVVAACTGGASIAWQSYGDAAEAMIARWAPQRVLALLPLEKPAQAAQQPAPPAVEPTAANAEPATADVRPRTPRKVWHGCRRCRPKRRRRWVRWRTNSRARGRRSSSSRPPLSTSRPASSKCHATWPRLLTSRLLTPGLRRPRLPQKSGHPRPGCRTSDPPSNLRPKMPAHPPRTAARARKPMPPPLQQAATAPMCRRRPRLTCRGKSRRRRRPRARR